MTRIYRTFIAVLIALTAGCQPISGNLTVARPLAMELTETDGQVTPGCLPRDGNCNEPVVRRVSETFHPGSQEAQLDMDAPDVLRLVIDRGTGGAAVVRVAIKKRYHLPKTDGRFELAADESGQVFHTNGVLQTVVSFSPVLRVSRAAG